MRMTIDGQDYDADPEYVGKYEMKIETTIIPKASLRERFWAWRWNHIWRHFFTLPHETRNFLFWRW